MDRIEELNLKIEQMEKELRELKLERLALKSKSSRELLKSQRTKLGTLYRENDSIANYIRGVYSNKFRESGRHVIDICFDDLANKAVQKVSKGKGFEDLNMDEKLKVREEVTRLIDEIEAKF